MGRGGEHPLTSLLRGMQKLDRLRYTIEQGQKGVRPLLDDARCTIMRACIQQLTFFACNSTHEYLMSMDNHAYAGCENDERNTHYVHHRNREDWKFTIQRVNGKWRCIANPEDRFCWRNVRLGRPCPHILLVWCKLLRQTPCEFDLNDISKSFNKVFRRSTYMNWCADPFKPAPPPPEPCEVTMNDTIRNAVTKIGQKLVFMMMVTEDEHCNALKYLERLVNM